MANIVCLVNVESDRATFTWSEGPASFEPYQLEGGVFADFKDIAHEARERLADVVKDYLHANENLPQASHALAETGHELYQQIFDPGAEQLRIANAVRQWLTDLRDAKMVDTLEIVMERAWSLPWNVLYDDLPDREAFLSDENAGDHWKPFWGLRYRLAGGRRVNPLRRMPLPCKPHVLLVLDPEILDGLPDDQQQRLAEFIESHRVDVATSKAELKQDARITRPDLLYWFSHATPEALVLGGEEVRTRELRKLLRWEDEDGGYQLGGFAFLNACQTADSGGAGSFFDALHTVGFSGMVGTEHQTVDTFAAPLGLDFLEAFLDQGESVGAVLQRLRARVPLGLLYGTYCPPNIRVQKSPEHSPEIEIKSLSGPSGIPLSEVTNARGRIAALPDEPYRSFAYYDREDRALLAGRDRDVERCAALLDDSETCILVLHGESAIGKSSFLRAGLIPFLEEECFGYGFLRGRTSRQQDSVMFIRATNDPFGQLAHALCEYCDSPFRYETPLGESVEVDLPGILARNLEGEPNVGTLSRALRSNLSLLGRLLAGLSERLPYALVVVIDQGEEVFTLAHTTEDAQTRKLALEMLRQSLQQASDHKVILSIRTEYHGRMIDGLRRDLHDVARIREYLLTDFDQRSLTEAILRPTRRELIPNAAEAPFRKYRFTFQEGVAEEISRRVIAFRNRRADSVLPLVQVICTQLYQLVREREDALITASDLESLGGIESILQRHVETSLDQLLTSESATRSNRLAMKRLFTQLYLRQPDGSLTTALLPQSEVAEHWAGRTTIDGIVQRASEARLLRVSSLSIGGEEERRYVSLGHDALAKIAANWDEELSRGRRHRKMIAVVSLVLVVALVMAGLAGYADVQRKQAEEAQRIANVGRIQAEVARIAAEKAQQAAMTAKEVARRNEHQHQQIALASRLVDRAQLMQTQNSASPERSVLLTIESLERHKTSTLAHRVLREGLALLPPSITREIADCMYAVAYSPDGDYLVTASSDNTATVWDLTSGQAVVRLGHDQDVVAVSFSPDGKYVGTGSRDSTARVWQFPSGRQVKEIRHDGWVEDLEFSANGEFVATGSGDNKVRLMNMETLDVTILEGHTSGVIDVAISPDSRHLATASRDNSVRVWEIETAKELWSGSHGSLVKGIAFSRDGRYLASTSYDRTTRVWTTSQATRQGTSIADVTHATAPQAVAFSPNGDHFATATDRGVIVIWTIEGQKFLSMNQKENVNSLAFSPDGLTLVTCSDDRTAKLWDMGSGQLRSVMSHQSAVTQAVFNPNGRSVATASIDDTVRVWQLPESVNYLIRTLEHEGQVASVAFSPDSRHLATARLTPEARIWDLRKDHEEYQTFKHQLPVHDVALSPDGEYLATASDGIDIHRTEVWQLTSDRKDSIWSLSHADQVNAVVFSPDSRQLASVGHDGKTSMLDLATGKMTEISDTDEILNDVAFGPNGDFLAAVGSSGNAHVWDFSSRQEVARLAHENWANCLAFSPDGKHLATGTGGVSALNRVYVWDWRSGQEIARIGHENTPRAIAFSPDGQYLATATWGRIARIFETASWSEVARVDQHTDAVVDVAFSPDGRFLATASWDGSAKVWDWTSMRPKSVDNLINDARSRLTRDLTRDEWKEYLGDEPYRKTTSFNRR